MHPSFKSSYHKFLMQFIEYYFVFVFVVCFCLFFFLIHVGSEQMMNVHNFRKVIFVMSHFSQMGSAV